tara:strand:+ start:11833 stop:12849 length:1017 start_codon:yes stop_codon:yes gene_type:complete
MLKKKTILITGSAGFIGFHLSKLFLKKGWIVIGLDGMTNYYDLKLKKDRHKILSKSDNFKKKEFLISDINKLSKLFLKHSPLCVVHLAAQAGVRYSLEEPKEYLDNNIISTFNILEMCKIYKVRHLLISSTSSVYGNNDSKPFKELEKTDGPLSFYAATKKSCEVLSHSYSHCFKIPITLFRFFTVYGPWGRPDMALFKFTESILNNKEIEIFNYGNMERDFTYINDLISGVFSLIPKVPKLGSNLRFTNDTLSKDAPYRIVNIGNSSPTNLLNYIEIIEKTIGIKAKKKFVKHQTGDVKSTWSDISLIKSISGYTPKTNLEDGIKEFIMWYRDYYKV